MRDPSLRKHKENETIMAAIGSIGMCVLLATLFVLIVLDFIGK